MKVLFNKSSALPFINRLGLDSVSTRRRPRIVFHSGTQLGTLDYANLRHHSHKYIAEDHPPSSASRDWNRLETETLGFTGAALKSHAHIPALEYLSMERNMPIY